MAWSLTRTRASPEPKSTRWRPWKSKVRKLVPARPKRSSCKSPGCATIGGEFHRHTEISGDGARDGGMIDAWRYFIDASYLDWAGCCDHDNCYREYPWWRTQKLSDAFHLVGKFVTLFSYERSVRYPEGHRNLLFAQRGVRPISANL